MLSLFSGTLLSLNITITKFSTNRTVGTVLAIARAHLNGFLTQHVSHAKKSFGSRLTTSKKAVRNSCVLIKKSLKFRRFTTVMINSFGNRTLCHPIRSVIIFVVKQIGHQRFLILLITRTHSYYNY